MEEKEMSSGAEKVERIEQKPKKKTAQKTKPVKKNKEEKLALKEARLQKRLERREKRAERRAAMAEARANRKEERAKRRDMLKHETATQRLKRKEREKKERLAYKEKRATERKELRLQRKEARLKRREQRLADRAHRRENRKHAPGFGGWLAAVISLGVVTLALSTVVMVGGFRIADMDGAMLTGYRSSFYELSGLMEDVETDLSKLRVANGTRSQQKLVTDLYVNSALVEGVLEHIPVDGNRSSNLTGFFNRMNAFSEEALKDLNAGNPLTEEQQKELEALYQTQMQVKSEVNRLVNSLSDKNLFAMLKGAEGDMLGGFEQLENLTLGEVGKLTAPTATVPSRTQELGATEAEELCKKYFADYRIKDLHYAGEAITSGISCYNFELTDENDRGIFVQIGKGGELVEFDSHENCQAKNFDLELCEEIAEDFLESVGFEDMETVWVSENGTQVTFTYVFEQDDVLVYGDRIQVKVCETRGKVVGLEAATYWKNHKTRTVAEPALSKSEARAKLRTNMNVINTELCLIPQGKSEVLCYEFAGKVGDDLYFVYVDASTGDEVEVYRVENTKQGQIRK